MRLPGIAGRFFLTTTAIVLVVLAAVLAVASHAARSAAREAEQRGLDQAADLTAQLLAGRGRSLAGGARVFVQGPYFRALVAERRRDDILDQAFEAANQLGADWVFITDEKGTLLAKSDEPAVQGASMASFPLVAGALEGRTMSGYGVSRDTLLFQTVAVPVVVPGAAPVGVLVATQVIDRHLALDVRAATGSDVVFYTLDTRGAPHVAAGSLGSKARAAAALPASTAGAPPAHATDAGATHIRRVLIGPARYGFRGTSLTTAGGDIVGGFVVGRPEDVMPPEIVGVRRSIAVAALLGLALALGAAWAAARRIALPARTLADAASRAVEEDYDTAARLSFSATAGAPAAEIAALAHSLGALIGELREKRALVAMLGAAGGRTDGSVLEGGSARSAALAMIRSAEMLAPGAIVDGRYELREMLGSGGTGMVYKAVDRTLGETVALKVLRPELLASDPDARNEIREELRITRRISHRNVIRTFDFGASAGVPFFTMEYVEGASLAAILGDRGALPRDAVLALARQLARGLEAAHEQGVLHGDLKPANLLVTLDGLLKIGDFGVAALVRRPHAVPAYAHEGAAPPQLAGATVGTPEYMAPELLIGGMPSVGSDLYAAGMVLHECLTGATPFQQDTPRAFLAQKFDDGRPLPAAAARPHSEPRSLEDVVGWMTANDPSDRPPSAALVSAWLSGLGNPA